MHGLLQMRGSTQMLIVLIWNCKAPENRLRDGFGQASPSREIVPDTIFGLELEVNTARVEGGGPPVRVVGGIADALGIEREERVLAERHAVIGLDDLLRPIVDAALSDEEAEPARGDVVAMRARQLVANERDAHPAFRASPALARELRADRDGAIDLRERVRLRLAVVPARAHETAQPVGELRLGVARDGLLAGELSHLREVGRAPRGLRFLQRFAKAAHHG